MWLDHFTAGELGSERIEIGLKIYRTGNFGRCYSWVAVSH